MKYCASNDALLLALCICAYTFGNLQFGKWRLTYHFTSSNMYKLVFCFSSQTNLSETVWIRWLSGGIDVIVQSSCKWPIGYRMIGRLDNDLLVHLSLSNYNKIVMKPILLAELYAWPQSFFVFLNSKYSYDAFIYRSVSNLFGQLLFVLWSGDSHLHKSIWWQGVDLFFVYVISCAFSTLPHLFLSHAAWRRHWGTFLA